MNQRATKRRAERRAAPSRPAGDVLAAQCRKHRRPLGGPAKVLLGRGVALTRSSLQRRLFVWLMLPLLVVLPALGAALYQQVQQSAQSSNLIHKLSF